jgi:CheY-like chemotaxis protein
MADPKRPQSMPPSSAPSSIPGRTPRTGVPQVRPSTIRDASAEAHALGGAAIARPSTLAAAGKKTVLLVDPDPALRARIRAMLASQYEVVEAKDGMEAVEMTSTMQPPALIVSDTNMPRLDGFTFAKILRNNPVMKRVPIMFVSAQHSPQHVTQALVIGVSQYLPKSTPIAQVVEKIRKIAM